MAFTNSASDFSELQLFDKDKRPPVSTANGRTYIIGHGTVFIKVKPNDEIMRIHPVFYLPGAISRLLSMGQLLHGKLCLYGEENTLTFTHVESNNVAIVARSNLIHENIYWVDTQIVSGSDLTALSSIHEDSYDLWHRRLGHPSSQVLDKFKSHTNNFPIDIQIPKNKPLCEGCATGKMHNRSFPTSVDPPWTPFRLFNSLVKNKLKAPT